MRSSGTSDKAELSRNGTGGNTSSPAAAATAVTGSTPAIREREVERFSHQELRAGLIYYVGKRIGQPGVRTSLWASETLDRPGPRA